MKIGICCYPSYGGSGVVATELGLKLAEKGHEVHFISYDKPFRLGAFHPKIYFHDVSVSNYPVFKFPPYMMSLANKIREIVEFEGLEILHAHYAVPHASAVYMAKKMVNDKIKTVTTLHGTDVTIMSEDSSLKEVMEFSVNDADAITAVSNSLREQAHNTLDIKQDIQMIYNFIDPKEYKRSCQKDLKIQLGLEENVPVLIHTSNFRPVKRIGDLIDVFKGIRQAMKAKLLLIGDGPERCMASRKVKEEGLEEDVLFLGKQNNVIDLLAIADLFLLPSEKESFGLAALEAMACEVPVIASKTGGLPELVKDGHTGYLSDVGDVEKMTKDALELLKSPDVLRRFRKNARKRAVEEFSADRIVEQYIALYQQLLDRNDEL